MPFNSNNMWLHEASRFWIWTVLAIPSTGLAFAFYFYRRDRNAVKDRLEAKDTIF